MPKPDPSADQLQALPTAAVFKAAFGADAQRQRLEQRERERRQREAWEALERRRQHFAALRQQPED